MKNQYKRYVVVGSKKLGEHGYSTALGTSQALDYAIQCADHHSMYGRVFGETSEGYRELVYTCIPPISKPVVAENKDKETLE
jgi:hypothetical protein